ncbi:pseudouridine synthase [Paraphysoderma sedebokerense]|nr:pseudouridine synthase [Paraphysoderma sedebokerense]
MTSSNPPPAKKQRIHREGTAQSTQSAAVDERNIPIVVSASTLVSTGAESPSTPGSVTNPSDRGNRKFVTEESVGIKEFICKKNPGFTAIIKNRYSDFVVNEINLDGNVVRVTNYDIPETELAAMAHVSNADAQENDASKKDQYEIIIDIDDEITEVDDAAEHDGDQTAFEAANVDTEMTPVDLGEESAVDNTNITEKPATVKNSGVEASSIEVSTPEPEAPKFVTIEECEPFLSALSEFVSSDVMESMRKMITSGGDNPENVSTGIIEDKARRTALYQAIKASLPTRKIHTRTVDNAIIFQVKNHQYRHSMKHKRGRGERPDWAQLGGDYLLFHVYKENMDTMEAISTIAGKIRATNKVFGYAGTKDKRGLTTQQVTAYHVQAKQLVNLNKYLRNIKVGNFRYVPSQLELGASAGNEFIITIRNVQPVDDSGKTTPEDLVPQIEVALNSLRSSGFINYYGMQRFGTTAIPTYWIGRAILQGKYEEAVELILKPREGDVDHVKEVREFWEQNKTNYEECFRKFPFKYVAEREVLKHLGKTNGKDYVGALLAVPRNLRLMYLHSYQSYIWNSIVSFRLSEFGNEPILGDLVVAKPEDEHLIQPLDLDPKFRKTDVEVDSDREPIIEPIVLTQELLNSGRYTIFDVVLPQPGFAVQIPQNAVGEKYKELLEKDDLNLEAMWNKNKLLAVTGSYRKFMGKATEVKWRWCRYEDMTIPLSDKIPVEESSAESEEELIIEEGSHLALVLSFRLPPSAYATMALREIMRTETAAGFHSNLTYSSGHGHRGGQDRRNNNDGGFNRRGGRGGRGRGGRRGGRRPRRGGNRGGRD